jgi:flavin-dependent dehydrogenase
LGAGPAGCAAALAALQAGASVRIFEKSAFPRHKVCGEFLSPGAESILERLGVANVLESAHPVRYTRFALHFSGRTKHGRLAEPGLGLSRYCLDQLLLEAATTAGAKLIRTPAPESSDPPVVNATGRRFQGKRGGRLFGFKSHFTGPSSDSVDLFFFDRCYVGVNCVEGGITNVCGLGPEEVLGKYGFDPEVLIAHFPPLRERVAPLSRSMEWLTTGPIYFRDRLAIAPEPGCFPVGDHLSFVDPFTGTGMLSALLSGEAAGRVAALGGTPESFLREISGRLRPALRASAFFRWSIEVGLAGPVIDWIPAGILVALTRPRQVK